MALPITQKWTSAPGVAAAQHAGRDPKVTQLGSRGLPREACTAMWHSAAVNHRSVVSQVENGLGELECLPVSALTGIACACTREAGAPGLTITDHHGEGGRRFFREGHRSFVPRGRD